MNKISQLLDTISSNKRSQFWLFFALLIVLSLIMMYLYQPLCPGQDFFFHYRRLQALMDGMKTNPYLIYLDYNAIDGYGYFIKAFYSDVILIPFAIIGNFTSISFAYQFMIFTSTILCGVFTYIAVNRIYKNPYAASISALLYIFALYRLLDIYHRAALGEALSFTFVPIVILGLYHIIKGDYKKWYILAVGFSLMIFTHLISTVLMFVTAFIILIIYYKPLFKEPKRILYLCIAGLATIIITAYYLFPMIEQMVSNTFYYESRQIMSKASDSGLSVHWVIWGMFSGITPSTIALLPGIGLLLTCGITLRLFIHEKSDKLRSVDIGVIIGIIYLFACTSFFPWSVFPFSLLNFIQMGWRLLEFASFFFAVAGGYYLSQLLKNNKRMLAVLIVVSVSIILVMVNDAEMYRKYRCGRPITQEATFSNDYHLGGLEYIPEKVPSIEFIHQRGNRIETKNPETKISNLKKDSGITEFDISTHSQETLELPLIYYKGYKAEIDGKKASVEESDNGLIQIQAENARHIKIYYAGTILQHICFYISLISILLLCIYIFVQKKKY